MTTSTDGLIRFEYDEAMLHVIEMALGNLKGESRKVLKNAVNATARQARKDLVSEAASVYTEKKAKINKTTKVKAAKASASTALFKCCMAELVIFAPLICIT